MNSWAMKVGFRVQVPPQHPLDFFQQEKRCPRAIIQPQKRRVNLELMPWLTNRVGKGQLLFSSRWCEITRRSARDMTQLSFQMAAAGAFPKSLRSLRGASEEVNRQWLSQLCVTMLWRSHHIWVQRCRKNILMSKTLSRTQGCTSCYHFLSPSSPSRWTCPCPALKVETQVSSADLVPLKDAIGVANYQVPKASQEEEKCVKGAKKRKLSITTPIRRSERIRKLSGRT